MSIEDRIRSTLDAAGRHINPTSSPITASHGSNSSSRSWLRRRLPVWPRTPVFASVLLVVGVGTALATFAGLLPWDVKLSLTDGGCRVSSSTDEMVASVESEGRIAELWITRPGPDQPPNGHIVLDFDEEGNRLGYTLGCSPPGSRHHVATDEVWVGVGGETSAERMLLTVLGRVSSGAAVARVTLSDGEVIDIGVQTDGYFIELVTRPGVEVSIGDPELPEAIHITALDALGQVIEEKDLPWDQELHQRAQEDSSPQPSDP